MYVYVCVRVFKIPKINFVKSFVKKKKQKEKEKYFVKFEKNLLKSSSLRFTRMKIFAEDNDDLFTVFRKS